MAPEQNLGPAGSEPSPDEVKQYINSLYDRAESATGTFNATRAWATGSRTRVVPAGSQTRGGSEPGLDALARRWFNAARASLGPTLPAVLPADRPAPQTAKGPSVRLAVREAAPVAPAEQLEPRRPAPELPAAPAPRPAIGPAEVTAGPALALEAAPASVPPATPATVGASAGMPQVFPPAPTTPWPAPEETASWWPAPTLPSKEEVATQPAAAYESPSWQATPQAAPPTTPAAAESQAAGSTWATGAGGTFAPGAGGRSLTAVAFARAQTGKPCLWGATGPDAYDCSSLTQAAWRAAGVDLPRTAQDQARAGTPVPLTDLQPGDLVFFHADAHHVGLCTGDGMMIHAPAPGAVIREEPVLGAGEAPVHSAVRPA